MDEIVLWLIKRVEEGVIEREGMIGQRERVIERVAYKLWVRG